MEKARKAVLFVAGALLAACGGSEFTAGETGAGGAAGTAPDRPVGGAGATGALAAGAPGGGAMDRGGGEGAGGSKDSAGESAEPSIAGAGGLNEPTSVPCDRAAWSATASVGAKTAYALDGMPTTRWTTDVPREPGQWFELDLGERTRLLGLELHTELYPLDSPGLVHVEVDSVPVSFEATIPSAGVLALEFDGRAARIVRIIASDHGEPVPQFMDQLAWWSIYEISATCLPR